MMTMYTIETTDGDAVHLDGQVLFYGPVPGIGELVRVLGVGRYMVRGVEHIAISQSTGTFATRVVVIVQAEAP